MTRQKRKAKASQRALYRIFTVPESEESTLDQIEKRDFPQLVGFLKEHIVAAERSLQEIEADFSESEIPEDPAFVSDHTQFILNKLVAHSVHTSAPSFIGHMTSCTSIFPVSVVEADGWAQSESGQDRDIKAFTPLERQVLGMMHRLVYEFDEPFYTEWMHSAQRSLGAICSGGTIANITALWVARNNQFKADGNFKELLKKGCLLHFIIIDAKARYFVSERGHYSLKKSANILGIGQQI